MAQQIATVWRDLDVENRVRGKEITDRRADFRFGRQNQETSRVRAEAELDGAAKHPVAFDTAEFVFSNLSSVRQLRARKRERNFIAHFLIGRVVNGLALRAAALVHFANCEPISNRIL